MKILYVANIRLPTEKAHGKQIMETCNAFAKLGQKITLLVPKRINTLRDDPFSFYGLIPSFVVRKIFCMDFLFLPLFKRLFFLMEAASFTVSAFLYGIVNAKKHEIIYTRDPGTAFCMPWLKPTVYEIHDLSASPGFFHRMAWRQAKFLIVISNGLREDLISFGADGRKIVLARDAVDIQKFDINISREDARKKLKIDPKEKIVLYTGHLFLWKGADLLAEIAGLISSVQIYFVGGSEKELKKFRKKYQAGNIHIVGYRPADEIPLWLKAADILVLPNRSKEKISAKYTSPLKLFEYMASGTPILAADIPAIKEVLNNERAVFFEPDNSTSLAENIKECLKNKNELESKAKAALSAVKKFTWEKRTEIIYTKLINQ